MALDFFKVSPDKSMGAKDQRDVDDLDPGAWLAGFM